MFYTKKDSLEISILTVLFYITIFIFLKFQILKFSQSKILYERRDYDLVFISLQGAGRTENLGFMQAISLRYGAARRVCPFIGNFDFFEKVKTYVL